MLAYGTDFWPVFWAVIGVGAALTVTLSALIAIPLPRRSWRHRQQPLGPEVTPSPYAADIREYARY